MFDLKLELLPFLIFSMGRRPRISFPFFFSYRNLIIFLIGMALTGETTEPLARFLCHYLLWQAVARLIQIFIILFT